MRKFLPYIFIFIVILGFFTPNNFVFGAPFGACRTGGMQGSVDLSKTIDQCLPPNVWDASVDRANSTASAAAPRVASGTGIAGSTSGANIGNGDGIFKSVVTGWVMAAIAYIAYLLMQIMSFFLWLSGSLLNMTIDFTIINMKENMGNMTGIDIAWRVIRDLINIAFIFILIYEGIRIIISQSDIGKAKGIIVGVIITSVLINFSVFFTKIIIDASNVATIGFYKSIASQQIANQNVNLQVSGSAQNTYSGGISGAFSNALNISSFFKPDVLRNIDGNDGLKMTLLGLFGALLFLILAFVFFAISAMFLIRYFTFLVLLVLSPLGFLGFGIPQLKSLQTKWWDTLIGQALFAPVYMIMTWVTFVLISSPGFIKSMGKGNWGQMITGSEGAASPDSVSIIINFGLIIFLAIMSLAQAKSIASKGASKTGEWTGKLTAFAGGALMGGTAALGRNTIGRLGEKLSQNENWKDASSKGGVRGFFAKQTLKASDSVAKSTFDARNTSMIGSPGWASKTLGVDMGKGGKENFRTVLDNKAKKEEAFTERLKPSEEKEKEFKKKQENYLNSAEYKKSDVYLKAEAERAENEAKNDEIKKLEETIKRSKDVELKKLEKEMESSFGDEREVVKNKVEKTKKEIENNQNKIKEFKLFIEKNNEAKKNKEAFEKKEKEKTLYKERASAYAETVESPGWLGKFTNAVNTVALGNRTTNIDRKVIGKRIRKKANAKTDEQQLADLAAKIDKKRREKEERENISNNTEKETPKENKEENTPKT